VLELNTLKTKVSEANVHNYKKYYRPIISTIFKNVDKYLPKEIKDTHRVGNPTSLASTTLETRFKGGAKGDKKQHNLVVDVRFLRQGNSLTGEKL
jgi:hypothetical protein